MTRRRSALADVDHATTKAVRARGGEPRLVGARQRMPSGKAVPQSRRHRLLDHGTLDAAHIGEDGARLEGGSELDDQIERRTRGHREHHQVCAAHGAERRVRQIGDRRGLKRLDALGSLGGIADHALDTRQAGLPGQRASDGAEADHRERGWAHLLKP